MQTFVPYGRAFAANAAALDMRRLGKQRVEGLQILRTLQGLSHGWANHPAVKMWDGYEHALAHYTLAICENWSQRGYRDTCADQVLTLIADLPALRNTELPSWLDDPELTLSHKSNLIRKAPEFYGPKWPNVPDSIPYKWPN